MNDIETRFLGNTGLRVPVLTLGTLTFGGKGKQADVGMVQVPDATRMVSLCLDHSVNMFDTSDVYSMGWSEEILGEAIGKRRNDVLIATKVHEATADGPNDRGQSRHHIMRACEASLRRLQTDYIDLYQVHNIDEQTAMEESLGALDDIVRQGKARYIGCSNYSAWHIVKALWTSEKYNLRRYVSLQANYSLVAREAEQELIPVCLDQNLGLLIWGPLSNGFLAGKQRRGQEPPKSSRRATIDDSVTTAPLEQAFHIIDALEIISEARNASIAQVAINWLLRRPGVTSVVLGARTIEQLEDNLHSISWELTNEEMETLNRVSARPLPYPYWQQQKVNMARLRYVASAAGR
jgi:aryl-alcohol dehydrogenase-like predicted oxidoreductase